MRFSRMLILTVMTVLLIASPAFAVWGDTWGEMVWGQVVAPAVPITDWLGLGLLVLGLVGIAAWRIRSWAVTGALVIGLLFGAADFAQAQSLTIPNGFTNGDLADANEVNANFDAVSAAVNTNSAKITIAEGAANTALSLANASNTAISTNAAAVVSNTTAIANNTSAVMSNAVAISSCATTAAVAAGCAIDTQATFDLGAASVDITTDNAAAAALAGETACTQVGGSWDAASLSCAPGVSAYDCYRGGICGVDGFNLGSYQGDTTVSTSCDPTPGSLWGHGAGVVDVCVNFFPGGNLSLCQGLQGASIVCQ